MNIVFYDYYISNVKNFIPHYFISRNWIKNIEYYISIFHNLNHNLGILLHTRNVRWPLQIWWTPFVETFYWIWWQLVASILLTDFVQSQKQCHLLCVMPHKIALIFWLGETLSWLITSIRLNLVMVPVFIHIMSSCPIFF